MNANQLVEHIDLTPSWGDFGRIYGQLAVNGEQAAVNHLAPDFARAMAAAQAFSELFNELTDDQKARARSIMTLELRASGY
jgi:hypothetical protein